MQAEIIMIGTELLLGQIVDTNAAYIGQMLAENGINLYQKTTVGDNTQRIIRALDAALARSDVVLTSGGLGPTEDDITRECIAELLGRPLEFREDLMEQLTARFARIGRPIGENNKKQACAPQGSIGIENPNGTAPGLIIEDGRGVIICMPGVPHELKAMLNDSVLPYLRDKFGLKGLLHYRVLKVCGMGESRVDEAIGDLMNSCQNPTIGVLASPEAVTIRIAARANTLEQAEKLIDEVDARVRDRLPGLVVGVDDETLEGAVDALLRDRGWTIALAETHTGGMIAQRMTAVAAESFAGGIVSPAKPGTRDAPAHAIALAQSARDQFGSDCALAIAPEREQGKAITVFICPEGTRLWQVGYSSLSAMHQVRATVVALEHLRRHLAGVDEPI